jgi:hypothetical protein
LSINNDISAIYKPFNENNFKPDKVLIWKYIKILILLNIFITKYLILA